MIKTKKNGCNLEKKLYEIIQKRYEEYKENWLIKDGRLDILAEIMNPPTRKDWEHYLDSHNIEHFHCDDTEGLLEFLMELINEGKDVLVCADPWINDENYGNGDGILAIPTKLAEKIFVLGFIS